jgi:2-methylcitrate synthase
MTDKKIGGAGLRGQSAGETCAVYGWQDGGGLTYRGYGIETLADKAQFEEVAYLLLYGTLPNQAQLTAYINKLKSMRGLPKLLCSALELIPKSAHPMDVMRTGCSFLGNLETEQDFSEQYDRIDRMLAVFPSIINYWYRYSHDGVRIDPETDDDSIGAHFLHCLHGKAPNALHSKVMNVSLISLR